MINFSKQMCKMGLTKSQLEILHILWSSDGPLSVREIADKSKYRIAGRLIVSAVIENLLAKEAVYQAGTFHSYSNKKETVILLYAAQIRFDEYYSGKFKGISSKNLCRLMERMLQTDWFSLKQLWALSAHLEEKTKPFRD